jgi:hypothetical protein
MIGLAASIDWKFRALRHPFSWHSLGGLEHLIVLRFLDAFFDELLAFASPFVILVLVGTFRCLVSG